MPPHNETVILPNGTVTVVETVEEMRVEHPAFVFTERICIAFFTVEYCLRMFAAPRKIRFAIKALKQVPRPQGVSYLIVSVSWICWPLSRSTWSCFSLCAA